MSMRQRRKWGYYLALCVFHRRVIVLPGIGSEVTPEEVFVTGAMPLVSPTLGDWGDRAAGRAFKVGALVVGRDFEFLDGLRRSRHYTRRGAACRSGANKAGSLRIDVVRPIHIVRVVAAVELVGVLVSNRAGDLTVWRHCGLQHEQRISIAAQVGDELEILAADRLPYRGVSSLQLGAHGCRYLNGL